MSHYSVLLDESIELLNIKPDGVYVDCTLGRGGHSLEVLKHLSPQGRLFGFDRDAQAIEESTARLSEYHGQFQAIHAPFSHLKEALAAIDITAVDGILFDLGVSSPQFDQQDRGFSYRFDARLDMRMDQTQTLDAYEVVNTYEPEVLIHVLRTYGEERYAASIVKHIVEARPVTTTFELVECIKRAYPNKELAKGHPGKKTFQAIRMEVNSELQEIETAIKDGLSLLNQDGRMVVISFHSLEDRLVKTIFNDYGKPEKVNPRIPVNIEQEKDYRLITKGAKASKQELEENRRSHSAILRAIERVKVHG